MPEPVPIATPAPTPAPAPIPQAMPNPFAQFMPSIGGGGVQLSDLQQFISSIQAGGGISAAPAPERKGPSLQKILYTSGKLSELVQNMTPEQIQAFVPNLPAGHTTKEDLLYLVFISLFSFHFLFQESNFNVRSQALNFCKH